MATTTSDTSTWVETSVPDTALDDRTRGLFISQFTTGPANRRRVFRHGDHWAVHLSAPLSSLVTDALSHDPPSASVDLVWPLVSIELSGAGTSALEAIGVLAAIGTHANPELALTQDEADELTRTGSLVEVMPPVTKQASARTRVTRLRILDEALGVAQVARLLNVSESRIRQRAAARTLYAVKSGSTLRFPGFQFAGGAELPNWEQVAPHFPADAHPVAVERFMDAPHPDLDVDGDPVSPSDWLLSGGPASTVADAVDDAYAIA